MPDESTEKQVIFDAGAVAFGGRIRRPDDAFIKSVAPSFLPVTGGLSEATVQESEAAALHYKNAIKFTSAYSRAEGDLLDPRKASESKGGSTWQNDSAATASVQTRLEGLHIQTDADPAKNHPERIFNVSKLECHLEGITYRSKEHPTSFRTLTTTFEGVSLTTITHGKPVVSEIKVSAATEIFSANDTMVKLVDTYAKDSDFRKKYGSCFHPGGLAAKGFLSGLLGSNKIPYADHGIILATIVSKLEFPTGVPEGVEIDNNRLIVSGFGQVSFGEIIIQHESRTLTLLRITLDGCYSGEGAAGGVRCLFAEWPPIGL